MGRRGPALAGLAATGPALAGFAATGPALAGLAAIGLLASAGGAAAWDNQGHMATGVIAYDLLSRTRPAQLRAVVALMASHPDRARFDRELGGARGPERDRLLLEYMARWPDDVSRTSFARPEWHYALRIVSPAGAVLTFHNGRAEEAYLRQLAVARDPRATAADRAVALCWVLHLVGDMHQPLHAGHWMSLRFPATDRAGTIAWVRTSAAGPPLTLHQFWDRACDQPGGEAVGSAALAAVAEARVPAASVPPLSPSPRAAFDDWVAASRRLALEVAYDGGRFEGAARREEAVALATAYLDRAHEVAVRRIGEAGVRIAQVLSDLPVPLAASGA